MSIVAKRFLTNSNARSLNLQVFISNAESTYSNLFFPSIPNKANGKEITASPCLATDSFSIQMQWREWWGKMILQPVTLRTVFSFTTFAGFVFSLSDRFI